MIGVSNKRAAAARVGQRERAAGQLIRADLPRARALREIPDLAREAADVQVARLWMTGTISPRSVSTAIPRCSASW
jgi:hypothetical protein